MHFLVCPGLSLIGRESICSKFTTNNGWWSSVSHGVYVASRHSRSSVPLHESMYPQHKEFIFYITSSHPLDPTRRPPLPRTEHLDTLPSPRAQQCTIIHPNEPKEKRRKTTDINPVMIFLSSIKGASKSLSRGVLWGVFGGLGVVVCGSVGTEGDIGIGIGIVVVM